MNLILIRAFVVALDRLLTGKPLRTCWRTSESQVVKLAKLADWDTIEYYLSDCGLSRLWIAPYEGRIFVTDNSLAGVKTRWAAAPMIVANIIEEFEKAKA